MKSQAKLTYGGVARALGFTDKPAREPEAERLRDGLRVAYELSRILRTKRMKRGALDFELPEPKVILDAEGNLVDIKRSDNNSNGVLITNWKTLENKDLENVPKTTF